MKHSTQTLQRETKIFAFAAPALQENSGAGAANVMGILDQADDVIFPGFWTPVLADFLTNGFVPVGHKWDELPVAYPTIAEERGCDLYTEWTFHSTQAAQDARTVARERIAAGKSMGLSVGFLCAEDGILWFKNGAGAAGIRREAGFDLSLFDADGDTRPQDNLPRAHEMRQIVRVFDCARALQHGVRGDRCQGRNRAHA